MKNDVYFIDCNYKKYNNDNEFNPYNKYKEAIDLSFKTDEILYDKVRCLLANMGLDKKNMNKKNWNPFGDFIKEGNKVVIKPNLVKHINSLTTGGLDELITNISIIRPILDYVLIALNNTGEVIIGDAPVQECDFNELLENTKIAEMINKYNEKGYNVKILDFRKHNNDNLECITVHIDKDSSHCEMDKYYKKFAITNYDLKQMHEHHSNGKHEYLFPKTILDADVIINMPKPKCHRKAGMTACMKNFVGINSLKEYLPHHRIGDIKHNGDEFPENSIIKRLFSKVSNYTYKKSIFIRIIRKALITILKIKKQNRYLEGSWYGNDTIWRTICDINRLIMYCDKNGNLINNKKRVIFNFADMIVCGEKEGPLLPTRKEVGYLVAGFNQLSVDETIAKFMGFDPENIKYIKNGKKIKKYPILEKNYKIYSEGNEITELSEYNNSFVPSDGWKDLLSK